MKSSTHISMWVIAGAFLVVLIGVIAGHFFQIFPGGLEVTSVTAPSSAQGKWLVEATAVSAGTDTIVGTLSPEQTKQMSGTNKQTQYPLQIIVSAQDEDLIYRPDLRLVDEPILSLQVDYYEGHPFASCEDIYGKEYDYQVAPSMIDRLPNTGGAGWCIDLVQVGVYGHLREPELIRDAKIVVQKKVDSTVISSDAILVNNKKKAALLKVNGLAVGRVEAVDLGLTGSEMPRTDLYVPYYLEGNNWRIASSFKVDDYDDAVQSIKNDLVNWRSADLIIKSDLQHKINEYTAVVDELTAQDLQIASTQTWLQRADKNDANLKVSLDSKISTLRLKFELNADWIGYISASGIPKVMKAGMEGGCYKTGREGGKLVVDVENLANSPATFVFELQNCNFEIIGETQFPFSAQQRKATAFEVSSLQAGDLTQQCSITVKDQTDPSKYDSKELTVCQQQVEYCEQGKRIHVGNLIKECQNGQYVTVKKCQYGVKRNEEGKLVCAEQGEVGDGDLQSTKFEWHYLILVLIPLLAALVGYATKNTNKKTWAAIGGVAGFIAALVLYLIVEFVLKNWIWLVLGGAAGMIIFYLLGGFGFIAILAMMFMSRR